MVVSFAGYIELRYRKKRSKRKVANTRIFGKFLKRFQGFVFVGKDLIWNEISVIVEVRRRKIESRVRCTMIWLMSLKILRQITRRELWEYNIKRITGLCLISEYSWIYLVCRMPVYNDRHQFCCENTFDV